MMLEINVYRLSEKQDGQQSKPLLTAFLVLITYNKFDDALYTELIISNIFKN